MIDNKTKLKRLRRQSHFMMDRPSVTVRSNVLYFSTSAVSKLSIEKYSNCFLSVEDGIDVEDAIKVYVEFNNEPASEENYPVKMHRSNGCMVSAIAGIFNQIPRLRALLTKKRSDRRIFLEKDNIMNMWFFSLAPQFERSCTNLDKVPEAKAIYQLVFRGNIQRIGETNNLSRRCKEYQRENIPFDEIRYSIMNRFSDEERKQWESFHIQRYVRDNGTLPPYNYQNGKNH